MPPAPSAAKLMADNNVTVESGSGKRGQVLKGDVLEALRKPSAVKSAARCARPERRPCALDAG